AAQNAPAQLGHRIKPPNDPQLPTPDPSPPPERFRSPFRVAVAEKKEPPRSRVERDRGGGWWAGDSGDDRLSRQGHYHGPDGLNGGVREGSGCGPAGMVAGKPPGRRSGRAGRVATDRGRFGHAGPEPEGSGPGARSSHKAPAGVAGRFPSSPRHA